jgi:hypothetical protein
MAKSIIVAGAHIKIFINNKLYKEAQQVSYTIDYGVTEIFGIDSPHPQEMAPGRVSVQGQVQGLRISFGGGLQGYDAKPLINEIASSPYISIRIQDRRTQEDLLFLPSAMITNQSTQVSAKGTLKLSFSFKGMVPFEPLDRA